MGPLLQIALQMIPILVMALSFSVIYIFLPNTKVKFSAAFTGALVAALLTMAFQFAIIKLGVGVSKYNKIYGALAAIPIFLFWVKTSWMILLMGAEVAFSVQNAGTYARERLAVNPSTRARLCLAVALMKKITDKFESTEPPFDTIAYGIENRIPIRLINEVINILAQAGLVAESAEHPGCYTLLRDPLKISARDIADAILDDGATPATLGLANDFPMFGKITDPCFQTLEKELLKNF
jgi:membrane protein